MLKIGELAKLTNCSVLTIRFYEKQGLIQIPDRTQSNYRLYKQSDVDRIKFILNCRSLNMSLNEIKQLLTYQDQPDMNCSKVNHLVDKHIQNIYQHIEQQKYLIEQLIQLRKSCDGMCSMEKCGVIKQLS
ncbi:Cd(II)/Pb(II)-responsive transcriptional regulator [Acinetobacter qingfengensis]|uniref:Cd(II)/Pb(II)-responsive transcriptional regulator n=1 Tax=Acinetobacter qingfengensis TaxID=1262585 RepID=A0A1E7RAT4_9GAMM|nr:Cd(II)/Pb(II)-responsive transcriptional regulator [Acinetobacter qingfengensis]OEY96392.1 Cd(II)/Pb(II)-responsive transcriptional regulator [Acinetobacter qingfengensis]